MYLKKAAALAASLMVATTALADVPFYEGKTIELIIPASPGGSYGLYGQLVADHLGRHIEGTPEIVPNHIRGAGGMRAANHVGQIADNDGTQIFMMHQNTATSQLLYPDKVQYDAATLEMVGVLTSMNSVMVVRSDLAIDDVETSIGKNLVIGSTGRGSYQFIVPALLNSHLGTDYNIVTTYGGTGETMLALERGEIGGLLTSFLSLNQKHPEWLDGTGSAQIILQIGGEADAALPDTPLLTSLARNEDEAAIYRFLSSSNSMARSLALPAGTPEEQVAIIRAAFEKMVTDPDFVQDVARLGAPLAWKDHEELRAIIDETLATPVPVIESTRGLMGDG